MAEKVQDKDGFWGEWKTMPNGANVFIRDGENLQDALSRHIIKTWNERDEKSAEESIKREAVDTYLEDYEIRDIQNNDIVGRGGFIRAYKEYMKAHNVDDNTIEDIRSLMNRHGANKEAQEKADTEILEALQSNSSLGKALKYKIDFEEKLYKLWAKEHAKDEEPWKVKIYADGKSIYRKGERKKIGVECWTSNEEGADMGSGGIGYDIQSTVEQLLSEGYHILGGVGNHHGAPGEEEVTFVKW